MTQGEKDIRSRGRGRNGLRQYLSCKRSHESVSWNRQNGKPRKRSCMPGDNGDLKTRKNASFLELVGRSEWQLHKWQV